MALHHVNFEKEDLGPRRRQRKCFKEEGLSIISNVAADSYIK